MKKVDAITVSVNYLERKRYSIKLLYIGYRKSGKAFWFVRHVGMTDSNRDFLIQGALKLAKEHDIPFIPDIRHGESVTPDQKVFLIQRGVAVR